MSSRSLGFAYCLFASSAAASVADPVTFQTHARPLLEAYCLDCHDGEVGKPKGDFDLARFSTEADARGSLETWQKVYRALDFEEMPPPDEKQPARAEVQQLLAWLEVATRPEELGDARDPGRPVLRRLNRLEYNNTVRDLLGLETDVFMFAERLNYSRAYFNPASGKMPDEIHLPAREYGLSVPCLLPDVSLPGDTRAERGFNNRGDALNLSALRMEKYLEIATEIVNHPDLLAKAPKIRAVFGEADVRARLAHWMERAFRRPVETAEIDLYFGFYENALAPEPTSPETAMKEVLRAILASPHFLYLAEPHDPGQGPVRPVSDFELASRLSYFLWSSMPDGPLLDAARAGNLDLEAQTRRMLRDPKVKEFTESFVTQWLQLNELPGSQPDPDRFKSYYTGPLGKRTLTQDLLAEPIVFFETILTEDRSILELIDSDWIYANHLLIDLYDLDESAAAVDESGQKKDARWVRVSLPDRRRGGVLTMGGILTMTSTPLRTSPVFRGSWLAEVILNRPPPPPPAAVGELGEDDKSFNAAGLTSRDKIREHRDQPACAGCHSRIDPLGFPLEHFNAIGRWRPGYNLDLEIDATGHLFGRRSFDGVEEFKTALLEEKTVFVRGFAKHLLSYALGRELSVADEPVIDEIVAEAEENDYRFSALVTAITTSYPFRHVRNLPGER